MEDIPDHHWVSDQDSEDSSDEDSSEIIEDQDHQIVKKPASLWGTFMSSLPVIGRYYSKTLKKNFIV
jgi:hypothetical protein